jgi:hypothetical protein
MHHQIGRRAVLGAGLGLLVAAGACAGGTDEKRVGALTIAEFEDLHRRLQPPAEEPWRALPWHNSILTAQALAAKERKPVYMLVRSGHPLGCV